MRYIYDRHNQLHCLCTKLHTISGVSNVYEPSLKWLDLIGYSGDLARKSC